MTADLWDEASWDQALAARQASVARAEAALEPVLGFLLLAGSEAEYIHRRALAYDRIEAIAAQSGLTTPEIGQLADQRWALVREAMRHTALPEGVDPLDNVTRASESSGYGSGPDKPDEHDEGPDYSHGYSEVPQGAPGGPVPQVVTPQFPGPQQVAEATGAKHPQLTPAKCPCGRSLNSSGHCKGCKLTPDSCTCSSRTSGSLQHQGAALIRAQGQGSIGADSSMTPQAGGTAAPSTGQGGTLPAGLTPGMTSPDGLSGGVMPAPSMLPTPAGSATPAQVTSGRRDPVAEQITAVAASVRASNPQLPDEECRRVARKVVGQYLRTADVASSVVSDDPGGGDGGQQGGKGGGGGGGGTGPFGHMLEYRGLTSLLPEAAEAAAI